jgi:hypothetical protein
MKYGTKKFTKEYKNKIKKIFLVEGLQKAFETVWQEFPKTTKRTIKTWVDEEYNKRVQETRRKSHIKVKTQKPAVYAKIRKKADEKAKHLRKTDPEFIKYRKTFGDNWAKNNRHKIREYDKKYWRQGGKEKRLAHIKKRNETDLEYRLRGNTRARAHSLFKRAFNVDSLKKPESTIELFGCTLPFLIEYLRKQYKPGMTDKNYGEWELDHIKPCVLFDFTKKEERLACFHYSNLQPL